MPRIFTALRSMPAGFTGEAFNDGGRLDALLDRIAVYRGRFNGPLFDVPGVTWVGDPTVDAISGKMAKKYTPQGELSLLAYIDTIRCSPTTSWLPDLDDYLKSLDQTCQFAHIYVFDCRSSSVHRTAQPGNLGVMTQELTTFFNFAYGSNMSTARLRARVPSARVIGRGVLDGHQLVWHKISKDGSGKCDVVASDAPGAAVHGVVYAIDQVEKGTLDRAEGLGKGYDERQVVVEVGGEPLVATLYFATRQDPALKPYSWYRAHVLAGAKEHELPPDYIAALEAVEAVQDMNASRHAEEMALVPRS